MTYKTILVSLNDAERRDEILSVACGLGARFGAHLIGLFVTPTFSAYPVHDAYLAPKVIEAFDEGNREQAEKAEAAFNAKLKAETIEGEFRHAESSSMSIAGAVVSHGRQADLVVAGQHNPAGTSGVEAGLVGSLVLDVGRPVLVVPYAGHFASVGKRAVVGWNATREASRAVFDALPLLREASDVWLCWADPQAEPNRAGDLPGSEIAATLARHGVRATAYATPTGEISAGDAILNYAADKDADLAVIGAYGRTRLSEFVFGGVTSAFLDHMTLPVLMSH